MGAKEKMSFFDFFTTAKTEKSAKKTVSLPELVAKTFAAPPTLETDRLTLCKIVPEYAEDMFEYFGDAVVTKYLTWSPHASAKETERYIRVLQKKYALTGRETEILSHLYRFESNTEIADALGIRDNTLQKHLQNLFRKLGVASKWEILRL